MTVNRSNLFDAVLPEAISGSRQFGTDCAHCHNSAEMFEEALRSSVRITVPDATPLLAQAGQNRCNYRLIQKPENPCLPRTLMDP